MIKRRSINYPERDRRVASDSNKALDEKPFDRSALNNELRKILGKSLANDLMVPFTNAIGDYYASRRRNTSTELRNEIEQLLKSARKFQSRLSKLSPDAARRIASKLKKRDQRLGVLSAQELARDLNCYIATISTALEEAAKRVRGHKWASEKSLIMKLITAWEGAGQAVHWTESTTRKGDNRMARAFTAVHRIGGLGTTALEQHVRDAVKGHRKVRRNGDESDESDNDLDAS